MFELHKNAIVRCGQMEMQRRACKGGTPGVSDFAVATKYIEWLSLGAIALRVPGKLMWDANKRRFSNSEEANRYVRPFLRKGWELKV